MHGFAKQISPIMTVPIFVATATAVITQAQGNDSVGIAQRVIRATYPELKGTVAIGLDSDTESDWRKSSLVAVVVRVHDKTASNHTRVALVAHVRIVNGRFSSVLFSGSYVEQQDLKAIVTYARAQDDTAERVIEELKKAGLRFMTDEKAFLKAAALQRLEAVLGKIQSAEARFVAVPPIMTPVDYEFQPGWVVELQTIGDGNTTTCYTVNIEPMHFRLERISREICSK